MTAINVSPASKDLTETGRIVNRSEERAMIRRALPAYFRNGGMVASYAKGATWQTPLSVRTMIGRKTVKVDVATYVDSIKARLESKAAAKRRQHDERLARAAALRDHGDADKVWTVPADFSEKDQMARILASV